MNTIDLKKAPLEGKKAYLVRHKSSLILIFLAIVTICCGTILLVSGRFAFIGFYLFGFGALFMFNGIQIDHGGNKIRSFVSVFGYKFGDWYELEKYYALLVTTANGGASEFGSTVVLHELYLLSNDKKKQPNLQIAGYRKREEAIEQGNKIGDLLNFPVKINKFN